MGYGWVRLDSSQIVSRTPVLVGCVIVTPDANNTSGDVTLYDGVSTSDPQIITIRSGIGASAQVILSPALVCHRGLYAVKGTNVEECLVQWKALGTRGPGDEDTQV